MSCLDCLARAYVPSTAYVRIVGRLLKMCTFASTVSADFWTARQKAKSEHPPIGNEQSPRAESSQVRPIDRQIGVIATHLKQHRNVPSTGNATSAFSTTQLNAPQVLESQIYSAGPIGLTGAGNQNAERPSRCRRCHQQRLRTPRHVTSSAASGAPTQRDGHPGQPSPR